LDLAAGMAFVSFSSALPGRRTADRCSASRRVAPLLLSAAPVAAAAARVAGPAAAPTLLRLAQPATAAPTRFPSAPPAAAGPTRILVWFHSDLRTDDNEALAAAATRATSATGGALLPVFAPRGAGRPARDAAAALKTALQRLGSDLVVAQRNRDTAEELVELCRRARLQAVYYNHAVHSKRAVEAQAAVIKALENAGIETEGFWSNVLVAPEDAPSASYAAIATHARKATKAPVRAPESLPAVPAGVDVGVLDSAASNNGPQEYKAVLDAMSKEAEALRLSRVPELAVQLKPYMDVGVLSPRTVYQKVVEVVGKPEGYTFSELVWRSFVCATLHKVPEKVPTRV